jgi:hypothetical protein
MNCKNTVAAQSLTTATQVLTASSVAATGVASTVSMSTPQSMWSLVNQFQLILTLQLVGWYLSPEIVAYIQGFDFSSFSFSFIKYQELLNLEFFYDFIDTPLDREDFEQVDFESGSTLANNFSLLINIFWVLLLHMIFLGVKFIVLKTTENEKVKNLMNWLTNFFMFAIYIRILLEAFLFLALASLYEGLSFKTNTINTIVCF